MELPIFRSLHRLQASLPAPSLALGSCRGWGSPSAPHLPPPISDPVVFAARRRSRSPLPCWGSPSSWLPALGLLFPSVSGEQQSSGLAFGPAFLLESSLRGLTLVGEMVTYGIPAPGAPNIVFIGQFKG